MALADRVVASIRAYVERALATKADAAIEMRTNALEARIHAIEERLAKGGR